MSQASEILNALQHGETLTRREIDRRFDCAKAPARIAELRQAGWPISTRMVEVNGKRFAEWRMSGKLVN